MSSLTINSKVRMNSGYEIPVLGYGVYQTPAEICESVVAHALKVGYRHIDSAAAYRNEKPCGAAIVKSGIPRSEIFFTSKIPPRDLSYKNTVAQVDETLKESGLDYIDLILIHSPYGGRENRLGAWKALVEAREQGKVRSIGVSNYGIPHLDELEAFIKEMESKEGRKAAIDVGQYELHPWLPRNDIVQWMESRKIVAEAYSPLVRNRRSDDALLQPMVKKYGKTPTQILLRWSVQKGFVPLPKSVTPNRIEENAAIYDFALTDEEMKTLTLDSYQPCAWDPTVSTLSD